MAVRIVRLGSERHPDEGVRLGAVRRPPRGVKKADWARLAYFDQWLPDLAPSAELVKFHQQERPIGDKRWKSFATRYRREMSTPERQRLVAMLARLSHTGNFSVGCYCEEGT